MDKSYLEELAEDANKIPSDEGLTTVSALAKKQLEIQQSIENLEVALEEQKKALFRVSTHDLPEAMIACGMKEFTLDTGERLKIAPFVSGNITDKETAHDWLRHNGYGDIVKQTFEINLRLTNENEVLFNTIREYLKEKGINWNEKTGVHYQTLNAWLRDMIDEGQFVDRQLFNVFQGFKATINRR